MPEIELVGPIAALSLALVFAVLVRVVLALSSRADTRRAERVLRRLQRRGEAASDRGAPQRR